MSKFYHSVYLKQDRCIGCFTCLKRCPTGAIRIRDGKACIIPEFCIDCGECNRRCPHHAKRSHRDEFETVMKEFKYTVALPAPALYAQFNNLTDVNIVLTALLYTGFDDVFEVSAGAELVSEATHSFIQKHPHQWPFISTACPTIERLIRVRFPNLIPHLLPILPPMEVAAKLARKEAMKKTGLPSEDIGIVFLSPCPSKVTFIHEPLGLSRSNVDRVLAIKDFYPTLLGQMRRAEQNTQNLTRSGKLGKGWAASGGEAAGIRSNGYLAADGIENCIKVLEDLEDEKFEPGLQFVELNSCSAGCVGGIFTVENAYLATTKIKKVSTADPLLRTDSTQIPDFNDGSLHWTEAIQYEPVYSLGSNIFENMEKMEKVDQLMNQLPGLNCGCCGSPTCRDLATDIVREEGNACLEDCIFLLKNKIKNANEAESNE